MATGKVRALHQPENLAELLERLGDVPLARIRTQPPPGTATEKDVLAARDALDKRLCELVDGVLVEKTVGAEESVFAMAIGQLLLNFVRSRNLGVVLGPDGMLRILPKQVRIPDVCFISWDRLPGRKFPKKPIPHLAPNLAVEVLSASNTKKEMERKLRDFFAAGVELVWLVQPKTQTAEAYTSPVEKRHIGKEESLDGGTVVPGFSLPLEEIFAYTEPTDNPHSTGGDSS
jgi:Uma2 family endonuclease